MTILRSSEPYVSAPMPPQRWIFQGYSVHIVDGDTFDVYLDVAFHGYRRERLRLLGLNTPEVFGTSKEAGLAAKAYVVNWLAEAALGGDPWYLVIQTYKSDVFGRYLATVWRTLDSRCLNDDLLSSGNAVPYP